MIGMCPWGPELMKAMRDPKMQEILETMVKDPHNVDHLDLGKKELHMNDGYVLNSKGDYYKGAVKLKDKVSPAEYRMYLTG
ncbi:hypothetical protein ACFLZZ_00975 [Nanoarchaeota archaeon]